jgi:hypothetical protein
MSRNAFKFKSHSTLDEKQYSTVFMVKNITVTISGMSHFLFSISQFVNPVVPQFCLSIDKFGLHLQQNRIKYYSRHYIFQAVSSSMSLFMIETQILKWNKRHCQSSGTLPFVTIYQQKSVTGTEPVVSSKKGRFQYMDMARTEQALCCMIF